MKILSMIAVLGTAALAVTVPSAATANDDHSRSNYQKHHQRHDRLQDRHEDNHEELNEIHDDAHDQGVSRRGHRRLHKELRYEHAESDYQLARQHQQQDRRAWQRQFNKSRYYRYRGY